ncbi:MAG: hypothetical protein A2151_03765 [Candidatus Muproteobacteria bacterium RBG_16_65_34]|uniref:RNA-binding protein n=1 Tax=Candidatus Muproteobacteria bacterium RBG_16_65_34 TaxID=1817760 RepID=A0A1F6TRW2_9PROT|nr:MAG: hypothetical protein A2151_03765 [Candidatus Muproteobacteria bacterium RBG_16_65_34]
MSGSKLKKIGLFSGELLRNWGVRLEDAAALQVHWRRLIDEPLSSQISPIRYQEGRLSLRAPTSAWASRVRQRQRELIERLRRDAYFKQLLTLEVRIEPTAPDVAPSAARAPSRRPSRIPAEAVRFIRNVADGISDESLRESLRRLSGVSAPTRGDGHKK